MRFIISTILAFLVMISFPLKEACAADTGELDASLKECGIILEEIMQMPEEGIPKKLLSDCAGIAIFPSTIKGAFLVGGRYGEGVVIHRDQKTKKWSPPAFFTVSGISFGWQIGGQAIDLVFVIPTERGFEGMLQNKLNVGSNYALVAGPVGRNAELGADITLKGGIFTYSRSKGLFAGIGLKGIVIEQRKSVNTAYYGKDVTARDILLNNKVEASEAGSEFISTVKKYSK